MKPVLFPSIDIRGGRCVRLLRGDFEQETIYGDDLVERAQSFQAEGASWVHVVDLDAARTGESVNRGAIRTLVSAVDLSVQVGGGIRSVDDALRLFEEGVARVVIGTAAVESPDLVDEIAVHGRVAVALDVRGKYLAVRRWTDGTQTSLVEAVDVFENSGVDAFVVTQIEQDGSLEGPDILGLAEVLEATRVEVVASGGVGSLDDLQALVDLQRCGRRLAGVIVGRAIYEGIFDVSDATVLLGGLE